MGRYTDKVFGRLANCSSLETFVKRGFTVAKNEVTFLGYRISREGRQPDPRNVEAVLEMKPPTKVKEVRRFLGITRFYGKHIHKYAKIATTLIYLTRKKKKNF